MGIHDFENKCKVSKLICACSKRLVRDKCMFGMMKTLIKQLTSPSRFFSGVRTQDWKSAFVFLLWMKFFISVVTPIVNYLGIDTLYKAKECRAIIVLVVFVALNFVGIFLLATTVGF